MIVELERRIHSENNIGLFMSGGFDSTTLAYTVFKIISVMPTGPKLTVYTVPRYDDSVIHTDRVCDWLKIQFPNVEFTRVINGNPNLHHSQQVLSGVIETRDNCTDLIILGDTTNPEVPELKNGPTRTKSSNPRIIQPFIDGDKRGVIELANSLGVLDQISTISHTCTESKTLRCNTCWQCRERAWAFSKLNLNDVGTM